MVHIPVLRTRRLTVQLRELSIGESVGIAAMPPHMAEATCSAFLQCAVQSSQGGEPLANWTVQERMLAVCHYLAATAEDGPDFSVGRGRYSDYLDGAADIESPAQQVELGNVGGDVWCIGHLTGAMAESIERMRGEVERIDGRLHWLLGGMAAQLVRHGEDVPDASSHAGAFDEHLVKRMRVIAGFPESDFLRLMSLYLMGRQKLYHLFKIDFSDDGILAMPKMKGGVASELPPAKFPVHTCLSRLARELVCKTD